MNADLTYHHLRRIVRALTPPAGQPPRMHLPVPVHTASGPAVNTTVLAEHLLHLLHLCTAASAGDHAGQTTSNLLGITRSRFSGAVVHLRQHSSSTSDGAAVSHRGEV